MISFAYQLQNVHIDVLKKFPVDLLVLDNEHTKEEVSSLAPKKVIAYISIGEAEDYRSYWKKEWKKKKPVWLGAENKEWKGNYTVKQFWHEDWWLCVRTMLDEIMAKGYSGIAMDKIDVFDDLGGADELKEKMILFVKRISEYCKSKKPSFLIIAHNASELLNDAQYLKAIDGITQEDLIYNWESDGIKGSYSDKAWQAETIKNLQIADKKGKMVLVLEYVAGTYYKDAKTKLSKLGFASSSAPRDLGSVRLL